jgi:uncharacterized protein
MCLFRLSIRIRIVFMPVHPFPPLSARRVLVDRESSYRDNKHQMRATFRRLMLMMLVLAFVAAAVWPVAPVQPPAADLPWWVWAAALFVFSLVLGTVAVAAGVGGGVLFVPIVGSVFPFHLDFVRGAGLMVALAGALAAGPRLLRCGLADLKLGIPLALIGSVFSIMGAYVGLALPTRTIQLVLGVSIITIAAIMLIAKRSDQYATEPGPLVRFLGIGGTFVDGQSPVPVAWTARNMRYGLPVFSMIGFLSGLFGLGAGWANVPALNLLLRVPLKLAVGTSSFIIAVNDSAAAWIYLNSGAILPLVVVPAAAGMMIGASLGARLLEHVHTRLVKSLVLVFMALAGLRALLRGLGIWE